MQCGVKSCRWLATHLDCNYRVEDGAMVLQVPSGSPSRRRTTEVGATKHTTVQSPKEKEREKKK